MPNLICNSCQTISPAREISPGTQVCLHPLTLRTFNTWFWLIAILGYGQRCLNFTNWLQQAANQAAYPFYILHQTVIIVIGFFVVQWYVNLWIKFFVIAAGAFILTLLSYDVGVRRTNVTRFLFGMKLQERRR